MYVCIYIYIIIMNIYIERERERNKCHVCPGLNKKGRIGGLDELTSLSGCGDQTLGGQGLRSWTKRGG